MSDLSFSLTGFDPKTERLVVEYDILPEHVAAALRIAKVDDEPHADYPLDGDQAQCIALLWGRVIAAVRLHWFLSTHEFPRFP